MIQKPFFSPLSPISDLAMFLYQHIRIGLSQLWLFHYVDVSQLFTGINKMPWW